MKPASFAAVLCALVACLSFSSQAHADHVMWKDGSTWFNVHIETIHLNQAGAYILTLKTTPQTEPKTAISGQYELAQTHGIQFSDIHVIQEARSAAPSPSPIPAATGAVPESPHMSSIDPRTRAARALPPNLLAIAPSASRSPTPRPLKPARVTCPSPGWVIDQASWQPDSLTQARLIGRITNKNNRAETIAMFSVTAFDSSKHILETTHVFVSNISPNSTQTFEVRFYTLDPARVASIEIAFES